jgi:hypothetical protein
LPELLRHNFQLLEISLALQAFCQVGLELDPAGGG